MARLNQLGPVTAAGSAAVSADLGGAASVRGLSVPQSWAVAAPPIRLTAAPLPGTGAHTASAVEAGGNGYLLSEMMLASMATRAIGGTVRARPTVIPRSPAAG
jgi:hypothetical protein